MCQSILQWWIESFLFVSKQKCDTDFQFQNSRKSFAQRCWYENNGFDTGWKWDVGSIVSSKFKCSWWWIIPFQMMCTSPWFLYHRLIHGWKSISIFCIKICLRCDYHWSDNLSVDDSKLLIKIFIRNCLFLHWRTNVVRVRNANEVSKTNEFDFIGNEWANCVSTNKMWRGNFDAMGSNTHTTHIHTIEILSMCVRDWVSHAYKTQNVDK